MMGSRFGAFRFGAFRFGVFRFGAFRFGAIALRFAGFRFAGFRFGAIALRLAARGFERVALRRRFLGERVDIAGSVEVYKNTRAGNAVVSGADVTTRPRRRP